jgi:hypothetical protein
MDGAFPVILDSNTVLPAQPTESCPKSIAEKGYQKPCSYHLPSHQHENEEVDINASLELNHVDHA